MSRDHLLTPLRQVLDDLEMQATDISYLSEGAYNIVFAADLGIAALSLKPCPCVIRTAKLVEDLKPGSRRHEKYKEELRTEGGKRTLSSSLILEYVHQHAKNTPEVLHYDSTSENALGRPFSIQTRLPGWELSEVWCHLNRSARHQVIEQLADFSLTLESIKFPLIGDVETVPASKGEGGRLAIRNYIDDTVTPVCVGAKHPVLRLGDMCKQALARQIDIERKAFARYRDGSSDEEMADDHPSDESIPGDDCSNEKMLDDDLFDDTDCLNEDNLYAPPTGDAPNALRDIGRLLDHMKASPDFKALLDADVNDARLVHGDLHMGNIIANVQEDLHGRQTVQIGVIDFDRARAEPLLMFRRSRLYALDKMDDELRAHSVNHTIDRLHREQGPEAVTQWHKHMSSCGPWVNKIVNIALGLAPRSEGATAEYRGFLRDFDEKIPKSLLVQQSPTEPVLPKMVGKVGCVDPWAAVSAIVPHFAWDRGVLNHEIQV